MLTTTIQPAASMHQRTTLELMVLAMVLAMGTQLHLETLDITQHTLVVLLELQTLEMLGTQVPLEQMALMAHL
jgi:hypothetical protein